MSRFLLARPFFHRPGGPASPGEVLVLPGWLLYNRRLPGASSRGASAMPAITAVELVEFLRVKQILEPWQLDQTILEVLPHHRG